LPHCPHELAHLGLDPSPPIHLLERARCLARSGEGPLHRRCVREVASHERLPEVLVRRLEGFRALWIREPEHGSHPPEHRARPPAGCARVLDGLLPLPERLELDG
jgi:hypothetical protein